MDEILPGVFVGDAISARKKKPVIQRIVNVGQIKNFANLPSTHYLRIDINDTGSNKDLDTFDKAIPLFLQFMDMVSPEVSPVLIHCQLGVSRSCSLVIVYLLAQKVCKTVDEAIEYIKAKRSVAFINRRYVYRKVIEDWLAGLHSPQPLNSKTREIF